MPVDCLTEAIAGAAALGGTLVQGPHASLRCIDGRAYD